VFLSVLSSFFLLMSKMYRGGFEGWELQVWRDSDGRGNRGRSACTRCR
jgi:hypothetical protein